jgi:hypothetical protein
MNLAGGILVLALVGIGFHFLRVCSDRFMMLRRAKSFTPYWWGIGGMLSMLLITLALIGAVFLIIHPLH